MDLHDKLRGLAQAIASTGNEDVRGPAKQYARMYREERAIIIRRLNVDLWSLRARMPSTRWTRGL